MTIRAVVTDIEGTTSSIAFVKDELFPFARAHLPAFVAANRTRPEVRRQLDAVCQLERNDALTDDDVVAILLRWIDENRKATPLKTLEGMVWEDGYRAGELHGHVYPDAVAALRRWHQAGLQLYVYSSGSVAAQKLLFGHTAEGDLTDLFAGHFDTTIGIKLQPESYRRIANELALPPSAILFLSDMAAELDAAKTAGFATACLDRGEAVVPAVIDHPRHNSFDTIDITG